MRLRLLLLLVPFFLAASAQNPAGLTQNLTGPWVGVLEYRDFQTNERVLLPTWLTMTPGKDGNSTTFAYVYDDGPTKTVREETMLTLSLAAHTATFTSAKEHTSEIYTAAGLEEFAKLGRGVLVLTGPGRENDKPVDVRMTLTLRRNLFTLVKETRAAGAEFKFRDGYTFTRAMVPEV